MSTKVLRFSKAWVTISCEFCKTVQNIKVQKGQENYKITCKECQNIINFVHLYDKESNLLEKQKPCNKKTKQDPVELLPEEVEKNNQEEFKNEVSEENQNPKIGPDWLYDNDLEFTELEPFNETKQDMLQNFKKANLKTPNLCHELLKPEEVEHLERKYKFDKKSYEEEGKRTIYPKFNINLINEKDLTNNIYLSSGKETDVTIVNGPVYDSKVLEIYIDLLSVKLVVFFGHESVKNELKEIYGFNFSEEEYQEIELTKYFKNCYGVFSWHENEKSEVMRYIRFNENIFREKLPFALSVITHEVSHAVFNILDKKNIGVTFDSNEIFSIIHGYLTEKIVERFLRLSNEGFKSEVAK